MSTFSIRFSLLVLLLALACVVQTHRPYRKPYDHNYKNNGDNSQRFNGYKYHPYRSRSNSFPPLIPAPYQSGFESSNRQKPINKYRHPDRGYYSGGGGGGGGGSDKLPCKPDHQRYRDPDSPTEKRWSKIYDKILNQRKYYSDCYYDDNDDNDQDDQYQQKYESIDRVDYDYDNHGTKGYDYKSYRNGGQYSRKNPYKPKSYDNYDDGYHYHYDESGSGFGNNQGWNDESDIPVQSHPMENLRIEHKPNLQYMSYYSMPRFYPDPKMYSTTTSTTTTTTPKPPPISGQPFDIGRQINPVNAFQFAATDQVGFPMVQPQIFHSISGPMTNDRSGDISSNNHSNNESINSINCNCTTTAPTM